VEADVLPCYVVCDFSSSMTDYIGELRAGLREFRGAAHADPIAAARVRVCLIGMARTPWVLQPLRPVVELIELEDQTPCAATLFAPVFEFLRNRIERDANALREKRLHALRPVVFFVSDGRSTDADTWPAGFAELTGAEMVAFGMGAADPDTLTRIGSARVFLGGVRLGAALAATLLGPRGPDPRGVHFSSTRPPDAVRRVDGEASP
jgi:uncharacterized protein YegL